MLAALLCAALAAAPATAPAGDRPGSAAPGASPTPRGEDATAGPSRELMEPVGPLQLRVAVLPLVSYGSNVGLQLGGALLFYRSPEKGGGRRDWLAVGGSYATEGPRSLEVKGERLRVLDRPLRVFYQAKYAVDDLAPYWGEGGRLLPGDEPGAGSPPPGYRYRAVGPWVSVIARHPLASAAGPWWAGGRVRFKHVGVFTPGEALRAARPPGAGGGALTTFHAGAMRDTRDEEVSASRGTLVDASVFGAPPGLSVAPLWGVNVGARAYRRLHPRLVLAVRGLWETKLGEVPFHERSQVEGLDYGEGLGGPDTIRGVARARLAGEEKLLANLELRAVAATFRPFDRSLELGFSAGADAGRARQRGHPALSAAGVFGGLRLIWDRALVLRLEVGHAGQGAPAYYLAFDESF